VQIIGLDHLVLTVADIEATVAYYEQLGMSREVFGEGRVALRFGDQKMNLHEAGAEITPHATQPIPGSADICLLVAEPLEQVEADLRSSGIEVDLGPVGRAGATSAITSLYVRDPDATWWSCPDPARQFTRPATGKWRTGGRPVQSRLNRPLAKRRCSRAREMLWWP
jgi:catechol 2,3-dioxygenase-like lactoylglutathione lyase family enzyme